MMSKEDFIGARSRIAGVAHITPVFTSTGIDKIIDGRGDTSLFFKAESLQKVGAFKFRGALNTVLSLTQSEASKGVATHSSGNHAQALALAARHRKIPAYIVMPESAPKVKVDAVKEYGGEVTFCPSTLEAREEYLKKVMDTTGATFIHPSDDLRVITGQGTAFLELMEQQPDLEAVLVPVGGGGLASGTALAASLFHPQVRVIGVEPEKADDAFQSLKSGVLVRPEHPDTVADGLRTALGPNTFFILSKHLSDIVTIDDETIIKGMELIWQRMKLVVEPSAAVPLAGLLGDRLPELRGRRLGIILSGGNRSFEQ
jgi:threonine dehydratase